LDEIVFAEAQYQIGVGETAIASIAIDDYGPGGAVDKLMKKALGL
jgi:hypothetical protein